MMYTEEQLALYFARIGLSGPQVPKDHQHGGDPLALLAELQKRQIAHVPFEDLDLHYSTHHMLSLDLDDLFEKIVVRRRGGYCMETNTFFAAVLRSLGFTLITCGAKVKFGERFGPWSHMNNIVIINGKRYMVDVGFGGNGPVRPMPLDHGVVVDRILPSRMRVEHKRLPQHSEPAQRLWVFSTQDNADAEWVEQYAFADLEFFPEDFESMNWKIMTSRTIWFTKMVTALRYILNEETNELEGQMILHHNYVRRRTGTENEILVRLENEEQRIKALAEHLDIHITAAEAKCIRGMVSELGKNQWPSGA